MKTFAKHCKLACKMNVLSMQLSNVELFYVILAATIPDG